MTTVAAVISEAKSHFQSSFRDEVNVLNGTINSSVTSLVVTYETGGVDLGAILSIDTELLYVVAYVSGTKTATVIRAWDGTTAASHTTGALIYVNPRVPDPHWIRHLNGELRSLGSPMGGLFKAAPLNLTYNSSKIGYNLTGLTAADEVVQVLAEQSGSEQNWVPLRRQDWDLQRSHDTGEFASSFSLRILSGAVDPGRVLRAVVKQPFTALTTTSQDVETDAGFPASAIDVLAVGMAIRAVAGREIARNFTDGQGDTRRAGEVPPGAVQQSAAGLRALYRDRRQEEAARLIRQYGL